MRIPLAATLVVVGTACATTYIGPPEQWTRSFEATPDILGEAALAALGDLDIAVVEAEPEHGRILTRAEGSLWDMKGHVVRVTLTDTGRGRVPVDANAETVSDESVIDFGPSRAIVWDFLTAVEEHVAENRGPVPTG